MTDRTYLENKVVDNQQERFQTNSLYAALRSSSDVSYGGALPRNDTETMPPMEERRRRFLEDCANKKVLISFRCGFQIELPLDESSRNGNDVQIDSSPMVVNAVCVRWRGRINIETLEGDGQLIFDGANAPTAAPVVVLGHDERATFSSAAASGHHTARMDTQGASSSSRESGASVSSRSRVTDRRSEGQAESIARGGSTRTSQASPGISPTGRETSSTAQIEPTTAPKTTTGVLFGDTGSSAPRSPPPGSSDTPGTPLERLSRPRTTSEAGVLRSTATASSPAASTSFRSGQGAVAPETHPSASDSVPGTAGTSRPEPTPRSRKRSDSTTDDGGENQPRKRSVRRPR